jgi:methionyl-tRNA formyltransferase
MSQAKYKVLAFLARKHGFNALQSLYQDPRFELLAVITHRRNPTSEDPERSERKDFINFQKLTEKNKTPLHFADTKKESLALGEKISSWNFDLITSISWRRLIPEEQLKQAKIGGINLHRGILPKYAGAEPIKQALLQKEKEIFIDAHILDKEIDTGRLLAQYRHPSSFNPKDSLEENIERIKMELTPHFGPLLIKSIDQLLARNLP